ncbi:hypothetical protein HanRHA438_Chr09g0407871 [Helianthus annuus]|nr:hypothetical protein HanRHA438_Chr09g0407871 [Helianthus annuus]
MLLYLCLAQYHSNVLMCTQKKYNKTHRSIVYPSNYSISQVTIAFESLQFCSDFM